MKKLLLLLLGLVLIAALAAGAWIGPRLAEDPGLVMIEFGEWRLQMSLVVLIGFFAAAWLGVSVVIAFIRLPGRAVRRARRARERRNLDRGLLALAEGDWAVAERALGRAMRSGDSLTSGYLAAARAAQEQTALDRRDEYLALADRRFGKRHFATVLARARLLMGERESGRAVELLEDLHLKRPTHQGVLKLLLAAYQDCERWHDVRLLIPSLKKAGIIAADRARELSALAGAREIEAAADPAALQKIHKSLKRMSRNEPEVVAALARRALEFDRPDLSEPALRAAISDGLDRDGPDPRLLELYSESDAGDRAARIRQCERWIAQAPESGALHFALGKLHLDARNDDRAREHLQIAVRSSPNPGAYAALAQVLDRAGLLESATQCYRNALRLEQGRAPEPLAIVSESVPEQSAEADR